MIYLPCHRLAVFLFTKTTKPLFISIKHTGHTGKGHLQQHRQFHFVYTPTAQRQITADIMAVQQIQLGIQGIFTIAKQKGGNICVKDFRADRFLSKKSAGVSAKVIIHSRIQHIAIQVMRRVFPNLSNDECIGFCCLYC